MTHVVCAGVVDVAAPLSRAFAFFTPEGERLWVAGWDPQYLPPSDGALQDGLCFRTTHGGETTLWFVSRLDAGGGVVDYVRITPGSRMGRVSVRCQETVDGGTRASVTYQLSALSAEGEQVLDRFAAGFEAMLAEWTARIATVIAKQG
jgi:hypothetical protein